MRGRNPDNPTKCPELMVDGINCFQYIAEGKEDTKCPFIKSSESNEKGDKDE